MAQFDGKVVVITGGNSGIGLATAQAFVQQGAQVAITGRDRATLDQAAAELGANVLALEADVTKLSDLDRLFSAVKERFGSIDVLFANAGIGRFASLADSDESLFDQVIDTNFKGVFFTIQKALPLLRDDASIILNGSVNAHVGFPNTALYAASKAAVHSLTRTLGAELIGRGIRVNTLNIGPVETPLYNRVNLPPEAVQGFAQTLTGRLPIKRFGQPDEIAKAVLFLASSDSSFVVGSEVTTDGGFSLNAV